MGTVPQVLNQDPRAPRRSCRAPSATPQSPEPRNLARWKRPRPPARYLTPDRARLRAFRGRTTAPPTGTLPQVLNQDPRAPKRSCRAASVRPQSPARRTLARWKRSRPPPAPALTPDPARRPMLRAPTAAPPTGSAPRAFGRDLRAPRRSCRSPSATRPSPEPRILARWKRPRPPARYLTPDPARRPMLRAPTTAPPTGSAPRALGRDLRAPKRSCRARRATRPSPEARTARPRRPQRPRGSPEAPARRARVLLPGRRRPPARGSARRRRSP